MNKKLCMTEIVRYELLKIEIIEDKLSTVFICVNSNV